jgi:hypothetical protein
VGDGVRSAKRSQGLFKAIFLSRLSIGWLRRSMDEFQQGGEVREFCRTFQGENQPYSPMTRQQSW